MGLQATLAFPAGPPGEKTLNPTRPRTRVARLDALSVHPAPSRLACKLPLVGRLRARRVRAGCSAGQ